MISPAWRHKEKVRQAQAAEAAKASLEAADQKAVEDMAKGNDKFKLLLKAIEGECKRISDLPQGRERTELKKQLLKTYLPVVHKYIEGDDEYKNTVLTQVMVWCFDTGEIAEAVKLAAVAIKQKQPMPKRYGRDAKTFVADAVLEWAEEQFNAGNPVDPYFSAMFSDVMGWSVHDKIKVKYLKLASLNAEQEKDLDKALEYCEKAEEIVGSSKAKVKTRIANLKKEIALRDEQAAAAEAAKK